MLFPVRRLRASRTTRGIAALCVLLMIASNALAAMGICIAKVQTTTAVAVLAEEAPCAQHEGGRTSGDPSPQLHCPQDDPGVQLRSGDVPAASFIGVVADSLWTAIAAADTAARAVRAPDDLPLAPLYARLSRLLL